MCYSRDSSIVALPAFFLEERAARLATSVKVRTKHSVTIPAEVRKQVPLQVGDRVEVTAESGRIIIRPVVEVPREQAWYWTEKWQTKEREADEDIAAGRFRGPFRSGKALIRSLKRRR